jgi:phosphoserine phosphatase RsbU/P
VSRNDQHNDPLALLQEENQRLRRAVEELSVLNELARAIGNSFNSEDVIGEIISRSRRAVDCEQVSITLIDRDTHSDMKTLVRDVGATGSPSHFHLNQMLLGSVLATKKPKRCVSPCEDSELAALALDPAIHSILCVPLLAKSEMIGVLTAYNKIETAGFTDIDQRLLGIIAAQSAQVIENARLYEEEKDLLQIKEQLRLAKQIQNRLLPKESPKIDGYDIAGHSEPALDVGGDYYDFIPIDQGRWALCLGDVSGKGLPASLLMAHLQATLRAQSYGNASVRDCVSFANRMLYRSTDVEKFVTLFYSLLDLDDNQLCYCCAGHEPPILIRQGEDPQELATGGMLVGILEDASYLDKRIALGPGDLVVCYSDGVTDAEDRAETSFGKERLIELLKECKSKKSQEIIDLVMATIDRHAAGMAQLDDITLVVIKRRS